MAFIILVKASALVFVAEGLVARDDVPNVNLDRGEIEVHEHLELSKSKAWGWSRP